MPTEPHGQTAPSAKNTRLTSWKQIAVYLDREVRTVQRWEKEEGLPVRRVILSARASVYADTADLDAWLESRGELGGYEIGSKPHVASRRWLLVAAPLAAVLILIAIALFSRFSSKGDVRAHASPVPLTSLPEGVRHPGLSPDANQVVFSWGGPAGDNYDIYVMRLADGARRRLTTDPAEDISPAWSPDGAEVAFIRLHPEGGSVYLCDPHGRRERKLVGTRSGFLDWIPGHSGERSLAIVDRNDDAELFRFWRVSAATGEKEVLLPTIDARVPSNQIRISPDGQLAAFVRWQSTLVGDLYITRLDGSSNPRRMTFDQTQISGFSWMPSGREIVLSSRRGGNFGLWRLPVSAGKSEPTLVPGVGVAHHPVISRSLASDEVSRLIYGTFEREVNIWSLKLTDGAVPIRLSDSKRGDGNPQFSNDGKRIAFASRRAREVFQIFSMNADGANVQQLTFEGNYQGAPRWSPDGERIAFDSLVDGNWDIYSLNVADLSVNRLTFGATEDVRPSWSSDGNWVFFGAQTGPSSSDIWKVPAGGGDAVRVTSNGGFEAFESPAGRDVYYVLTDQLSGLWRIPVGGGEAVELPGFESVTQGRWGLAETGIFFLDAKDPANIHSPVVVKFAPYGSRRPRVLTAIERDIEMDTYPLHASRRSPGFAVSRDGTSVLFVKADDINSELMLIDGFR